MKRFVKILSLCMMMALVAALLCAPASALGANEKNILSTGSVGVGVGSKTTLVDFTASDLCGFEVLGSMASPTFTQSGAWGTPVLYAWIDSTEAETGIRGTLSPASLVGAETLSVQLLAQYTKTQSYAVTLLLEGTDKNGAPLSLSASASVSAASWQTVTFDISEFANEVNTEVPTTVKLLTSSPSEDEQFVLWVHSLYVSQLESFPEFILPVGSALVGFVFGFSFYFIIYRATCKKNRRNRREEF
ncbi:MAG: hypothetical protein J6Q70_03280 [Clostridia bacterium]|nr:hypothetical protein [Clostridia bacterium]